MLFIESDQGLVRAWNRSTFEFDAALWVRARARTHRVRE